MSESGNRGFFVSNLTKRQFYRTLIGICLILGAFVAFSVLFGPPDVSGFDDQSTEVASVQPLPVNVDKLTRVTTYSRERSFTGTVRARNRSNLAFELGGRIERIYVDEGDSVQAGQVVAKLNKDQLLAQKNAAQANLDQAKSVLAELQAGPRSEKIDTAKANLQAAQSELSRAVTNLKRRERLRETGAVSSEEIDSATFNEKTARATLRSAETQLAELVAGTRQEKLLAQEAVVSQLAAALREIDVSLDKCELIAPFAGTVTERFLDQGTIAAGSVPVVRMVEQDFLEGWFGLPVDLVAEMKPGDESLVYVDEQSCKATLKSKIPELDPLTRTQMVVFDLDTSAKPIAVAGQLCEIRIRSDHETDGFWIPNSALSKGVRGLWSVMVVEGNETDGFTSESRDIELLRTFENRVLARGTLNEAELLVVDGVHRIADGQRVTPQLGDRLASQE